MVRCLVLTPSFLAPSLSPSLPSFSPSHSRISFSSSLYHLSSLQNARLFLAKEIISSLPFCTSTRLNFPCHFLSPILRQPVCRGIRPLQTQKGEPVSRYVLGFLASPRAKRRSSCSLNSHTHPQPLPISIAFQSLVAFLSLWLLRQTTIVEIVDDLRLLPILSPFTATSLRDRRATSSPIQPDQARFLCHIGLATASTRQQLLSLRPLASGTPIALVNHAFELHKRCITRSKQRQHSLERAGRFSLALSAIDFIFAQESDSPTPIRNLHCLIFSLHIALEAPRV